MSRISTVNAFRRTQDLFVVIVIVCRGRVWDDVSRGLFKRGWRTVIVSPYTILFIAY